MENSFNSNRSQVLNTVMKYFMFYWVLTGVGLAIRPFLPDGVVLLISFAVLAIVVIQLISGFFTDKLYRSKLLNGTVSLFMGVIVYTMISKYVSAMGASIVVAVVISAIILFAILGVVGSKLKADLIGWHKFIYVAMLAMFVASLVSIIFGFGLMYTIISAISLVIFSISTLVEFNNISKGHVEKEDAAFWGYSLYLNLLNMILDLLRLVYAFTRDE